MPMIGRNEEDVNTDTGLELFVTSNLPIPDDICPEETVPDMGGFVNRFGLVANERKQRILGLFLMAGAGLFLTVGNSFVQYVYKKTSVHHGFHLSSFQVLFIRSLIQLVMSILFMLWGKVHPFGTKKNNLITLLLMGTMEVGAIICIYLALQKMPIGDETVIQFTAPIFTAGLSFVILKRGCTVFEALCGCVSFLGVIIIAKPGWFGSLHSSDTHKVDVLKMNPSGNHTMHSVVMFDSSNYVVGALFALGAAMMLSIFYVLNKIAGKNWDVTLTIFYPSLIGLLVSPIGMAIAKHRVLISELSGEHWATLVSVGFISFIGLMFMAEAFQLEDPGPAALVRNLDVVYAFILQYALLSVVISYTSIIGAVLVLGATSLVLVSRAVYCEQCAFCCHGEKAEQNNSDETEPLVDLFEQTAEQE